MSENENYSLGNCCHEVTIKLQKNWEDLTSLENQALAAMLNSSAQQNRPEMQQH